MPDNTVGYNNLGGTLFYLGRTEEARETFERSLEVEPSEAALSNLGTIHFGAGRYAEAAELFARARELNPANHRVALNLAFAYQEDGEPQRAAAAFGAAAKILETRLEVNPGDPELLIGLAHAYVETGREPETRELLRRALDRAGDDVEVMIGAAEIYETVGERESAFGWIEDALRRGYPRESVERNQVFEDLLADPEAGRMFETGTRAQP